MAKPDWSKGWYYNIEIEKGDFTDGIARRNLAITRKLLRNVDVSGKQCLDIGTAEAVIPVLLKRAGAASVVAFDRVNSSKKIKLIKETYKADFDYVVSPTLPDLQTLFIERGDQKYFDLVVFSGVLYHLINPLGLLALVRCFCKIGGLFLLETRAVHDPRAKLMFNEKGRYGNEYFSVTTGWLDYALRMMGLEPLHAIFLGALREDSVGRLAVLCRSQGKSIPVDLTDNFALKQFNMLTDRSLNEAMRYDLADLLKTQTNISVSPYDSNVANIDGRPMYDAVKDVPPFIPTEDEMRLTLDATM
jgi:2-polyprenyl-3-methyl-5-hydroxy-6-metoxy-1,4-benzoquinol methylase